MLFSGKNCLRESLCIHGRSGIAPSAVKCWVGLRDNGVLLAIANLPLQGVLCQSRTHADWVVDPCMLTATPGDD